MHAICSLFLLRIKNILPRFICDSDWLECEKNESWTIRIIDVLCFSHIVVAVDN